MIRAALAVVVLFHAAAVSARAQDLFETKRVLELDRSGRSFSKMLRGVPGNARVKSFALLLDWWRGPGDDRVGVESRAVKEGFVFEVRHGREWHALPAAKRDLRLEARVEAPAGLLAGEPVPGAWLVRQATGDDPVLRVRIEITLLVPWGSGLAIPDLTVGRVTFDALEEETPAEGTYPLKRDFPRLTAGKSYPSRVNLANRGYGDARKPEIALFLTDLDGKGRRHLSGAKLEIPLREGEDIDVRCEVKVPERLAPGHYLLQAVADPRGEAKELDEENNAFSRVVQVVAGE